jgi:Ca2+/Na+ antiporter
MKHFFTFAVIVIFLLSEGLMCFIKPVWVAVLFGAILFVLAVGVVVLYSKQMESETEQSATSEDEQERQLPPYKPLSKSENAKIIIDCPKCFQKLRIPSGRHLRVTCPNCTHVFEV